MIDDPNEEKNNEGKSTEDQEDTFKEKEGEKSEEEKIEDDGAEPEGASVTKKVDEKADSENEDEDEYLTQEDEDKIGKIVKKQLAPFTDTIVKQGIESELNNILIQNPEYKPYEARIRRFVSHQNRLPMIKQGLPVKSVVLEAVSPYLEKIAIARSKAADEKAAKTSSEGSSERPSEKTSKFPDISKMNNKEIEQMSDLVKQGRYKTS